jgi:hypothetical protein
MSEATDQLDQQLRSEKELVELKGCADRLHANPDFRRLVYDEYLLKEPARLAMMAGDPIMEKPVRDDAMQMALAAGHFKRFMAATHQRGVAAEGNIIQINAVLDEVRAEEAND